MHLERHFVVTDAIENRFIRPQLVVGLMQLLQMIQQIAAALGGDSSGIP
jgi:hypothetical protein